MAVRSIRDGESSLALAGGVNIILQPHISIAYSQSRMMAADGRCKFGDASGDGYVRSEGVGLVVLKPLLNAVDDGDRIYAVIRGSAINNDGRSSGSMGTPSRSGQEELLRAAYDDAGGVPRTGRLRRGPWHRHTGGRPGRTRGPQRRPRRGTSARNPRLCRIGQDEYRSHRGRRRRRWTYQGVARAALWVHSAKPSLPGAQPGDPLGRDPMRNPACAPGLARRVLPRLAGVSAFGIAGTNGHVVLEQAPATGATAVPASRRQAQLLPLSAKSPEALRALAQLYADLLSTDAAPALHDVCWNAATRRTALDHRAVFVAADSTAMADALRRYASGEAAAAEGVVRADATLQDRICAARPGRTVDRHGARADRTGTGVPRRAGAV